MVVCCGQFCGCDQVCEGVTICHNMKFVILEVGTELFSKSPLQSKKLVVVGRLLAFCAELFVTSTGIWQIEPLGNGLTKPGVTSRVELCYSLSSGSTTTLVTSPWAGMRQSPEDHCLMGCYGDLVLSSAMNFHGTIGTPGVEILLGPKCAISSSPHSTNSHPLKES